jgi:hypothetical protein
LGVDWVDLGRGYNNSYSIEKTITTSIQLKNIMIWKEKSILAHDENYLKKITR